MGDSMIRVGKYEVAHQVAYLQMTGEDAILSFALLDGTANFRIRFIVDEEAEERNVKQLEVETDPESEDRGLLTFTNFHRSATSSTTAPLEVMKVGERPVSLVALVHYAKHVYSVTLQFMVEAD